MARIDLTDADLIDTLKAVEEYGTTTKAANALGLNRRTFGNRVQTARAKGLTAKTKLKDPLGDAQVKLKLLERKLAAIDKHNETEESIRKTIYSLSEVSPEPPKWITSKKSSGTPGVPILFCSDWHYGEVVRKNEVAGLNEFNAEIAADRIRKLFDRSIRLSKGFAFKEAGKAVKFPGIIAMLGGDMISGGIHEELAETDDRAPLECIDELLDLLIAGLTQLADEFGNVFVPCVVGNHGRTTKKKRAKTRIITSYEWNLYCNLERWFRNDPRVRFYIPNQTDALFEVLGHRILLTHGDNLGTRGGDGIIGAIGPIMRGKVKVGDSERQVGRDFQTLAIGHWHQEFQIPGLCVNNTLKGYDEFARLILRAPYSRPGQNLFFVHHEQGVTARLQVHVDDLVKSKKKIAPWVSWQPCAR